MSLDEEEFIRRIDAINSARHRAFHNLAYANLFDDSHPYGRRSMWIKTEATKRGIWLQALEWQALMDEYRAAVTAKLEARSLSRALNKPATCSQPKGGRL